LRNTGKAMIKDIGPPSIRAKLFPNEPVQGRNRLRLLARAGKVQLPYLIDPNTGEEMFESNDIMAYLNKTYAL
jgi:glutathione S-transferase